ncbi:MAG: hypothetical protein R3191_06605 [Anaerolineales bacterium]|nr:hypothetical protein [Anaerolineales bacterium]
MDIPHIPGRQFEAGRPLQRFLPPLEPGAARRLVEVEGLADRVVIDPYGSSPRLLDEAVRSGCRVVAAVNNPITRFALRARLDPFRLEELQTALAALAASEKDGQRLEDFLLDLYQTECTSCGETVHAEYFVWSVSEGVPVLKALTCPHCNHTGEVPASALDQERAGNFGARGLQRAMALETLAPAGDPHRDSAEAALSVYPARSLFALVTLVNKQNQLELEGRGREALRALLLAAFDAADNMWAHPEGRPRPKQLTPSPEFRETNLWWALERAVDAWARPESKVTVLDWPNDEVPEAGQIALFPGAVREFADTIAPLEAAIVLTVPPRPNQAYWTLSALWTSWLWGREAAKGIRAALRRRRYDWSWHAEALERTFGALTDHLAFDTAVHVMIPESEPGYLGACLAGWDSAGWQLTGRALRIDDRQARLTGRLQVVDEDATGGEIDLHKHVERAVLACLRTLGEPARFDALQAAAAGELAAARRFGRLGVESGESSLSRFNQALEQVLGERREIVRLDQRQELGSGVFWLSAGDDVEERLADRTERQVVAALRRRASWSRLELDREICIRLPGLQTPDRSLVRAAIDSYSVEMEGGEVSLRPEDEHEHRANDLQEIRRLLIEMGERLGFEAGGQDPIVWSDQAERYNFSVLETAILAEGPDPEVTQGLIYVIPGGRSSLLAEKARRDPRLRSRLETGQMVVKFRHVRRLASDTTLNRENLLERLALDPPEHQEPQLPLL